MGFLFERNLKPHCFLMNDICCKSFVFSYADVDSGRHYWHYIKNLPKKPNKFMRKN